MVDHFSIALRPNYIIHGVDAALLLNTADEYEIRAIDKTSGTEVMIGDTEFPTVMPAAAVMVEDLTALGLNAGDLVDGTLTINEVEWRIINHRPRPTPAGESKGELLLILRRVL
jgi:hypothetical protein